MKLSYPYTVEPQEGGGYLVQFVDIEEAFTEGETMEEAAFNAAEVLTALLAYRLEKGAQIPEPSEVDGLPLASPSAAVQSAILVHYARGNRPMSELARALETSWPAAQRLENPRHWPTLKQLDRAAKMLGKRLVLSLE
ncbi:MAG: HicB family protein [Deltaproteobacteria bacterium CG_4_10_14_3_um_filter_60_8]|nr:MAG: HicB family protein [Desulfobacterales bacterium CG2_30_60_27]PIP43390.1 MAG: HicB family protein [Deltaproteobacteria bacterium CG23_combo_of_CG06-09_8_20_14_all_60_8]PIY20997.1 MAG: HicB family protein [Deltaproteobacteria bacterium CG_4_10_14_3_um_filter_60_8]